MTALVFCHDSMNFLNSMKFIWGNPNGCIQMVLSTSVSALNRDKKNHHNLIQMHVFSKEKGRGGKLSFVFSNLVDQGQKKKILKKIFFSSLNIHQAKSGVKKISLY